MKLSKLFSALLAAAVLLCAVPTLVIADATALAPNVPQTVIPGTGTATLSFTPATSGLYECLAAPVDEMVPALAYVALTDAQQDQVPTLVGDSNISGNNVGIWTYYLDAGETYTLTVSDTSATTTGVSVTVRAVQSVSALSLDTPQTAVPGEYFTYVTFTPAVTDEYAFSSAALTDADPYLRGIWDEDLGGAYHVDGSPDDENQWDFLVAYELEAGVTYTLALYDYGSTPDGFTVTVSEHYCIEQQPTAADPTVKVNRPDTTYQWYAVTPDTVPVDEDDIGMNWGAAYETATGEWSVSATDNGDGTYSYNPFTIPLKAGDVLTVTSSDTLVTEQSYLVAYMLVEPEEENGSLVFTVTEDYDYDVSLTTNTDDSTFTLQVTTNVMGAAVSGQTSATLSEYEKNAVYACIATRANGKKVTSGFVKMVPAVTKQPTAADPSVKVSFEEDVKSYEWYTVDADVEPVTDAMVDDTAADAVYADGTWSNTDPVPVMGGWWGYSLFTVPLQAGDILTVTCDDAMFPEMSYVSGQSVGMAEVEQNGNALIFTVSDDDVYDLGIVSNAVDSAFTVVVGEYTLGEKIDGQTTDTLTKYDQDAMYACVVTYTDGVTLTSDFVRTVPAVLEQPTADKPTVKVNFADKASYQWQIKKTAAITADTAEAYEYDGSKATYVPADGAWTPTVDSYDDYGYFVIDAKAGDIVKIRLADGLEDGDYLGLENVTELVAYDEDDAGEDGVYEITVEEDGTYYLYVSIDTQVTAELERYEAVSGQTADTLTAYEADQTYRCVITYEGGETLVSDPFTVTQATIDQAAADEVAALINALPETITKADADAVAAAKAAYDALPDNVKALIADAVKAKLNAAVATIKTLNQVVETPEKPTEIPPTGEHGFAWLWAALAVMSGSAVCFAKQKTRNN